MKSNKESDEELKEIYETIREGAQSFLWAEYQICFIFIAVFGLLILVLTSRVSDEEGNGVWEWNIGALTATSFLVGGLTSILSGYIGEQYKNGRPCLYARAGCARVPDAAAPDRRLARAEAVADVASWHAGMMVAVYSNARTAVSAKKQGEAGWTASFNCAFRAVSGHLLPCDVCPRAHERACSPGAGSDRRPCAPFVLLLPTLPDRLWHSTAKFWCECRAE